jgi:putative ABC transport system permease protein
VIFLKIAVQNIRTHGKRTVLILFAVLLSVAVMEFIDGLLEGIRKGFFDNMVQESGHVQIHTQGWEERLDDYTIEYTIRNPKSIIEKLREKPQVKAAEPILNFGALLIKEEKNIAIAGHGIIPDTSFYHKVRSGMLQGGLVPEGRGICVSKRTAELLGIEYGGSAVVLVEDSQDSPYYMEFEVSGIFETDSREFDEYHFFLSIADARELLYLPEQTTEIRIALTDYNRSEDFASSLEEMEGRKDLLIQTWQDIHGGYILLFDFFDIFMIFIDILVVIVAATVITNAILMNMFERIEEFGTMRAIGMKKRQLFSLIMSEGAAYGVIGSLFGLAIGIPLVLYFQIQGLDLGEMTESFGLGGEIRFLLTVRGALRSFIAGVLIAAAGSLYAALVTLRKKIVDSLSFA